MFTHKKKNTFFLIALILASFFLRFYNLNWGAPFYFHPDERNIASSVSQLKFPDQMNPHFFAYGSLPIYTIYFTGIIFNFLTHFSSLNSQFSIQSVSFEQAIIIGRFFSALFSLALIPLLFFIGKKVAVLCHPEFISEPVLNSIQESPTRNHEIPKQVRNDGNTAGLLAAFFAAFSTGFIQFAHFATFEMWLTFFSLLLFFLCLKLFERNSFFLTILLGIIFGILVSTKVSHLVLLPLSLLVILIKQIYKKKTQIKTQKFLFFKNLIKNILLFFIAAIPVFIITNPFIFLDYSSFIGSMKYESNVALGTIKVFYTGEFAGALPVIFQFFHIYPFLINPLLTIIFIPSFFYLLFISIKTKNLAYIILNTFYLILFLSQAFLYAKWTRYMVPTLPLAYLICAVSLVDFYKLLSRKHRALVVGKYLIISIIGVNFLFAASYFITAFIDADTRIAAKNFAKQHIPSNAPILSEVYDLGITPFNDSFRNITLYNFYDLDNNSPQYNLSALEEQLSLSDYIILPSQRILKVRLKDPENYPSGHVFYSALSAQNNGFQKIYETPCDIFCKITYLGNPVYSFEETANVFDRPTVFIFKKIF